MVEKISELMSLSEAELIARHDRDSEFRGVGTGFYLDELRARGTDRLNKSVEKLTRQIFWLTVVVTFATLIQTGISIYGVIRN